VKSRPAFRLTRRARVVLALTTLTALAAFWLLHSYRLDLVHLVVVNATIQKAPPGYPGDRVCAAFGQARAKALRTRRQAEYLEQLLSLSQRLEKVQSLTVSQLDEILLELAPPGD
jgi:hypothetical protein